MGSCLNLFRAVLGFGWRLQVWQGGHVSSPWRLHHATGCTCKLMLSSQELQMLLESVDGGTLLSFLVELRRSHVSWVQFSGLRSNCGRWRRWWISWVDFRLIWQFYIQSFAFGFGRAMFDTSWGDCAHGISISGFLKACKMFREKSTEMLFGQMMLLLSLVEHTQVIYTYIYIYTYDLARACAFLPPAVCWR